MLFGTQRNSTPNSRSYTPIKCLNIQGVPKGFSRTWAALLEIPNATKKKSTTYQANCMFPPLPHRFCFFLAIYIVAFRIQQRFVCIFLPSPAKAFWNALYGEFIWIWPHGIHRIHIAANTNGRWHFTGNSRRISCRPYLLVLQSYVCMRCTYTIVCVCICSTLIVAIYFVDDCESKYRIIY